MIVDRCRQHTPGRLLDRMVLLLVCVGVVAALVSVGAPALAGDAAAAESLFRKGKELLGQKRYDEACPLFEASMKAEPSVGAVLNLALCREHQGRTATAWAKYQEAASLAAQKGQTKRERGARERAKKLEGLLSKLTIEVAAPPDGLVVKRNDVVVVAESFSLAIPVDPGQHRVVATAPNHKPWTKTLTVGADKDQQTVVIPALEEGSSEGAGGGMHTRKIVGFIVGGAGLVLAGIGTAFGVVVIGDNDEICSDASLCPDPDNVCSEEGKKRRDALQVKANIATGGVALGSAAVITGLVLVLTAPSVDAAAEEPGPAAILLPSVGPGWAGLTLTGRF